MKPTQEQVIAWARDSGMELYGLAKDRAKFVYYLEAFATLAYEAGQESMKWDGIHSCHPDCQRPACVHTRKTYQEGYESGRKDENEACQEICNRHRETIAGVIHHAIRARREQ